MVKLANHAAELGLTNLSQQQREATGLASGWHSIRKFDLGATSSGETVIGTGLAT